MFAFIHSPWRCRKISENRYCSASRGRLKMHQNRHPWDTFEYKYAPGTLIYIIFINNFCHLVVPNYFCQFRTIKPHFSFSRVSKGAQRVQKRCQKWKSPLLPTGEIFYDFIAFIVNSAWIVKILCGYWTRICYSAFIKGPKGCQKRCLFYNI